MTDEAPPEAKESPKKRKLWPIVLFSAAVLLVALIIFFWWLFWARFVRSTNDAYVHGNTVRLTPQVPGIVTKIYAEDTDLVEEGQILVELDRTDYNIAFEKAKNELAQSVRRVCQMFEKVYSLAAIYEEKQSHLAKAEIYYLNRKGVVQTGAISDEEFVASETNYYAAMAALEMTKYDLRQAISEVQGTTVDTHPLVKQAKDVVRKTYVNLNRCTLRAPATGIIAKRYVQVGQSVNSSIPLMAVVPLDQIWVEANFKEIHLDKIRIGQMAKVTSDMYGDSVTFRGQVVGIGAGTGAVFSTLPPQNATGNWIKIVQRVPVRIQISSDQLYKYPLRLGLTMSVEVNVRDTGGRQIPPKSPGKPIFTTDVFTEQLAGAEKVIKEVVETNRFYADPISHKIMGLVQP